MITSFCKLIYIGIYIGIRTYIYRYMYVHKIYCKCSVSGDGFYWLWLFTIKISKQGSPGFYTCSSFTPNTHLPHSNRFAGELKMTKFDNSREHKSASFFLKNLKIWHFYTKYCKKDAYAEDNIDYSETHSTVE